MWFHETITILYDYMTPEYQPVPIEICWYILFQSSFVIRTNLQLLNLNFTKMFCFPGRENDLNHLLSNFVDSGHEITFFCHSQYVDISEINPYLKKSKGILNAR